MPIYFKLCGFVDIYLSAPIHNSFSADIRVMLRRRTKSEAFTKDDPGDLPLQCPTSDSKSLTSLLTNIDAVQGTDHIVRAGLTRAEVPAANCPVVWQSPSGLESGKLTGYTAVSNGSTVLFINVSSVHRSAVPHPMKSPVKPNQNSLHGVYTKGCTQKTYF